MSAANAFFGRYATALQISPLLITLLFFLIGPMIVILIISLWHFNGFMMVEGDWRFSNYIKLFSKNLTLDNYLQTLKMLAITLAITTALGFTLAYFLVFDLILLRTKLLLFLLCVVPFWTSGVIRMVAWLPFLGKEGIINQAIMARRHIGHAAPVSPVLGICRLSVLHTDIYALYDGAALQRHGAYQSRSDRGGKG